MTGKVMYPDKTSAIPKAKQFGQRIYVCPLCFQYHLTSQADRTLGQTKPVKTDPNEMSELQAFSVTERTSRSTGNCHTLVVPSPADGLLENVMARICVLQHEDVEQRNATGERRTVVAGADFGRGKRVPQPHRLFFSTNSLIHSSGSVHRRSRAGGST
jgi:hypothetical protein